jgi:hypothetical protein
LVRLKPEDLKKTNLIITELNEKPFPTAKSQGKVIVKRTSDNEVNVVEEAKSTNIVANETKSQKKKLKKNNASEPMDTSIDENLVEEVDRLKKERACVICLERQKVIMFLPCAHLASCVECSVAMQTCPICRKKVEATIRTYI